MEDFIDIHLNGQLELYLSRNINKNDYDIFLSDIIDDEFWNFAYLKNKNVDFKKLWEEIKDKMINENRKPLLYITYLINNEQVEKELKQNNMNVLYTDVWMTIENLEQFKEYDSKIDFEINKVDNKLKNKFIQAIMDGFSGDNPEDPYESLSDGYRVALNESFKQSNTEYKVVHYLGLKRNEAITTATVIQHKDKAIIYNIRTNKKYQKCGACKKTMSYIVNDLKNNGIKAICLQTERGFYTEQAYKNMGFEEKMIGEAYIEQS